MIYYFDNCATTKVDAEILEILNNYHTENYFNPSSLNGWSLKVKQELVRAKQQIKKALNFSGNVYFVSGGTEADNLAILGTLQNKGNIVCNSVEHSAVYNCLQNVKSKGYEIRYAKAKPNGSCNIEDFLSLCDESTVMAVCMHVNNETGAINDLKSLFEGVKAKNRGILCFADGVQAVGKIPVNIDMIGADLYTLSSHKIHSTKGMGALLVKNGLNVSPCSFGGGQEDGVRNGTEYVGGAIAFAKAVEKATSLVDCHKQKFREFKEIIIKKVLNIPETKVVCEGDDCSDAILSFVFASIKGEVLLHMLEQCGIIVGHGSACSSKNKTPRIINELGLDKKYHEGLIRISFSKFTTIDEVEFLAEKIYEKAQNLRKIMGVK